MPAKAQQHMELEYQVKDTPKAKLVQAINEEWAEALKNDRALRTALKLRPGEATPHGLIRAPYDVDRKGGSVLAAATLLVAVSAAGIRFGNRVLMDVWQKILLPKLEDRFSIKRKVGTERSNPSTGPARRRKSPAALGKKKMPGKRKRKGGAGGKEAA